MQTQPRPAVEEQLPERFRAFIQPLNAVVDVIVVFTRGMPAEWRSNPGLCLS